MSATVTVTGVIGPAITATATVINNVSSFTINCDTNVLFVRIAGQSTIPEFAITSATTITATKSGSTYTLTIS